MVKWDWVEFSKPHLKDRDYATATGSAAISTGVVVLTPSNNAVVQAGQVTGYNVPLAKLPKNIPEVSVDSAEKRIVEATSLHARQLEQSIADTRDERARWFAYMLAAAASGSVLFFLACGVFIWGALAAGVLPVLGSGIGAFLTSVFYSKDSELRKIKERQEERLADAYAVLTAFAMASTIEDARERTEQKREIIRAMLNIPKSPTEQ